MTIFHAFWVPKAQFYDEHNYACLRCRCTTQELNKLALEKDPEGFGKMREEQRKTPWKKYQIYVDYISKVQPCISNNDLTIRDIIE